jgi:hypothetical protein
VTPPGAGWHIKRGSAYALVLAAFALSIACNGEDAALTETTPTPPSTPAVLTPTSTPTPAPEPPPTPPPSPTPEAVARPAPTDAVRCRETPAAESEPDCVYTGPLFDAHFHPYEALPGDPEMPDTALCDLLARDGVDWGLALYELPPDPANAPHRVRVIEGSRACVVPLVQPMYPSDAGFGPYAGFRRGDYSEEALDRWLGPEGPLLGVGEIAMYFPELHDVNLDHPIMRIVLEGVDARGGVAMIHPRVPGWHHTPADVYPNRTSADEIAETAARYPNTTFVIHGGLPLLDELLPYFEAHPNLYFSYETVFWFLEAQPQLPFSRTSSEEFARAFDALGLDRMIEAALAGLVPRLEQQPDRILWGLDRYLDWHFDEEISARWLELTRLVIARLPEDLQAPYAYENALRALGGYLDPPVR